MVRRSLAGRGQEMVENTLGGGSEEPGTGGGGGGRDDKLD